VAGHVVVRPGYYLSKRHWNTVTLDGSVPGDEVLELIGHACDLVVVHLTKAQQSKLITRTADPLPRSPVRDP
jgi:predicted DNA-binding protein (MmcQ/YjbR family)